MLSLFSGQTPRQGDLGNSKEPIRAELFSIERLEHHAEVLAAEQRIATQPDRTLPLHLRLRDNSKVLTKTFRAIVEASQARRPITPAAEWLLDNFHVVEDQIREVEDDLPPGFYRDLPKLADGPLQGYPRVVGIAWALVAHTDSALDMQKLTRFVIAYQRVQPLTIGETWALAITLRLTLVENLRRLADAIGSRMAARQRADTLADRMFGTAASEPEPLVLLQASLDAAPWSTAFGVQLALRARDHDPETTPALHWLNARLAEAGFTADEIVHEEVLRQGAANVTVRNVITSMRLVSMVNWEEFFESVSPVDAVMRSGSAFAKMDFPTRDNYRRAIEDLARGSEHSETEVAAMAIAAARRNLPGARENDPGYYLIAHGRREFERELGSPVLLTTRIFRLSADLGVLSYVGMIVLFSAVVLGAALLLAAHAGAAGWVLAALAVTGLIPATDIAVAVVNRSITQRVGARRLPALELAEGIPDAMRAIVVVPAMLTRIESVKAQVERLEVHHLSNPGDELTFALLTDWADAETENAPADDALLTAAAAGIARLNERYSPVANCPRFVLLHRRRIWNAGEGRWIGWERKRGKLEELNRLLRGATDTNFVPIDGHAALLPADIRYVITLDADTRMPIGTVRRLIGKMGHPLNRPVFDVALGRVVQGHAVLQPRVTPSLPTGSQGSLYERVFSGPNGLDPYALAVSDVYQDLFEEGSYSGKGIYDVDVFAGALDRQIPDNTVLSHDLLEGIFARAGLASDIEVVEEFPSRYDVAAARQHRWVRGDWQLLPWILGRAALGPDGARRAALPAMGRWKLLDNLRRSLSAPSALLALIVAWFQLPAVASAWTSFILLTIMLPPLLPALAGFVPIRSGGSFRNHARAFAGDVALGLTQSSFLLVFLAHQAWLMVDAVFRTICRLAVKRRLLEWVTSAQVDDDHNNSSGLVLAQVAASATFAVVVTIGMYFSEQHDWATASPFAFVWVMSPFIAQWASRPPQSAGHVKIGRNDVIALRLIARRTWRFFETFVGPEDNFLPPDNFQEDPAPVTAHRTSPTNIGLYLLSTVSAHDLGWLGTIDTVERLEATMATLGRMEQCHGHWLNWYDTRSLAPLSPRYVSSVDSGNLAGHLLALSNACRAMVHAPFAGKEWLAGVGDSVTLLRETLRLGVSDRHRAKTGEELALVIDTVATQLERAAADPAGVAGWLANLGTAARSLVEKVRASDSGPGTDTLVWAEAVAASIASHRRDFDVLAPWASMAAHGSQLGAMPTLAALPGYCEAALAAGDDREHLVSEALTTAAEQAQLLTGRLDALASQAKAMFDAMDFGFLYVADRQLLSIGFRVDEATMDSDLYDLLASESRLASFIAIAKGDVPAKHWFRLGRTMAPINGGSGLISWSGSMFEYLMPSLIMRAPAGSLLEQTNRLIVWRQAQYGAQLGVPWGISESAYNARDLDSNYQYSSFGVPDLGYKRGLGDSIVIAPYASGLGAMVDPAAALKNYRSMTTLGARGDYGWYEAIDYTRSHLPEGVKFAIIRSFMAHHQGMTLVSIANALFDGRMRERFHAEPIVQAAELLLQERMPRDVALARLPSEQAAAAEVVGPVQETRRRYTSAHSPVPRTHLLSNGRYSVMVTARGSGYSRWRDVAVTRWREDTTSDGWGGFVFLRDTNGGMTWSAAYQPMVIEPDRYAVSFTEDRAEIVRDDTMLNTTMVVMVSSEDDAEVRRVTITNSGTRERIVDVTSYAELSLARPADDIAHPAFAKLFVKTEYVPHLDALLATRRQRSIADPLIWAAHLAVVDGEWSPDIQFETDRARFLGRGRTVRNSAAITDSWPLSNTVGAILDPVFSLRRRLTLKPGATARIDFWTVVADSRDAVLALADKHREAIAFDRAAAMAWTQAQMQLRHLCIGPEEAHLFQRLAGHILYSDATLRVPAEAITSGLRRVSTLWQHGVSGDRPIVLVRVAAEGDIDLVRELLRAHEYWHLKQLPVDLVILNERATSYVQDLQNTLEAMVRMNQPAPGGAMGTAYVLRSDLVTPEYIGMLDAVARIILYGNRGSLADQLSRARDFVAAKPPPQWQPNAPAPLEIALPRPEMEFFNGLGGFTGGGREYLTILKGTERTPAPWLNVISNPRFGFQVTTDGGGFTWSVNSQQNQLTPWSNDPVSDAPGEVIYLTDEDNGEVWTPTALPIRLPSATYSVRHGQGYTRFEHSSHGIDLDMVQFVPVDDPIKIVRLTITDHSGRARRLSVTAYVEWVLGNSRTATAPFIVTESAPETGVLFARNAFNNQFGERVAFADLDGRQTAWTCDRREFLGRDGSLAQPLGLTPGMRLSNRTGAGLDPCAALQTQVALRPLGTTEIVFFLGQADDQPAAAALVEKYRKADLDGVFAAVTALWDDVLGTVEIKTPDRALDILVNRWLPYQTLACRVWARSAFYQASGAYGFRDQLQDVMALCVARPDIAREHVLRAAGRQFAEGDVQHWWSPESGSGIRTRITDDRVWLAFVVAHYVEVTGDHAVLDEMVPFLAGPVLAEGQHDAFFEPASSDRSASLFDHCRLALDQSLSNGVHGLPLMGTGDWNDGMDRVGEGGQGESVWLGWFLYGTLITFSGLADSRDQSEPAAAWRAHAAALQASLESNGWDGDWYRRAYFDNGEPLGSVANAQCRIDSIAQSWGVISGAAEPARAVRSMAALEKYLIRRDDKLSMLFTPPFDRPAQDPGYIKGYPAGIRENGGQYTHGAAWAALAFAIQGDGDKAGDLLAMLNPIRHSNSPAGMHRYKVEPYVACADVYSEPPHVGRGGWTWYTGSAGWIYRVALEWLLGFRLHGDELLIDPCIPHGWPSFEIVYRRGATRYEIGVENPLGVCRGVLSVRLDGQPVAGTGARRIPIVDDSATHIVEIVLG